MISNLRAILCNSEAKWKIKNFDPPPTSLKFCMQLDIVVGCLKIHFVRVATLMLTRKHLLCVDAWQKT